MNMKTGSTSKGSVVEEMREHFYMLAGELEETTP